MFDERGPRWPTNRVTRVLLGAALGAGLVACAAALTWALLLCMEGPAPSQSRIAQTPLAQPAATRVQANFGFEQATPEQQSVADWIVSTADHAGAPFFIIDKPQARLLVFDGQGKLQGAASVLLGLALGDVSVPGIGSRELADIRPEERTTPAGRFVAERGHNLRGEGVVWVDYDAAVSMHRVLTSNPAERRLERLGSSKLQDKRISSGCVNVPAAFFDTWVYPPVAKGAKVIIYILPDQLPLHAVFPALGSQRPAAAKQGA